MDGTLADGVVRVGGDARQRFYDAHGYGRPLDRNRIELAPVEAAHLLSRGDLDNVVDVPEANAESESPVNAAVEADKDRLGFRAFLARTGTALRFTVYKDLRDRGFYLSPARPAWPGTDARADGDPGDSRHDDFDGAAPGGSDVGSEADFVVYPRGKGPWDDEVAYRVRVVGEREGVPAASLGGVVLAVVDEDGELTYFDTDADPEVGPDSPAVGADAAAVGTIEAGPDAALPESADADLLADRVVCYEAAEALYESRFYGQRLFGRNADSGPLQFSLVEAAYLAQRGVLGVDPEAVVARGQSVEGDRFDRRLRVYAALRGRGVVPKSGFKFGADFRVYDDFAGVDSLTHSADLVRVVPLNHTVSLRDLSLDVRLAGGVRKRMVFARTAANGRIGWLSVARITP
ncbi:tRNA splicing endonuclease [Halobellus salinus]|uniref:tRNA-splicing endonuclease n=1 Tax=Halobellus salinus TaxID=931585 RepID=A0A830ENV7_9EURY|nr:tRNA-intron lyase [Halobellus salinus]GGJ07138.1 tRNA splicing endonuclease [Halobellus salinus]SMP25694.1 tRNA-intron endonuclease [Halobellus salinus]